ncbi:hemolysin family protein [Phenylobacterium terrae]|uniref:Hemolysin family protein n=1 Tax=Phenylobacterium terrae TaxID=2665495 RepID=A0ABW4N1M6_9CAUL
MTDEDDQSTSGPAAVRPSRGLRALFRKLRRRDWEVTEPAHPPSNGADLVNQAAAFQSLSVEDVMTPRADIIALELSTPFHEVVERFVEAEHSRMPIFRETLDDPVGVVHVKDIFRLLAADTGRPAADEPVLQKVRRDVLYVPGSMRAADLLLRMQTTRQHMALVIDEFGGTDGLVTLEDLVESVVGEIEDEHDEAAVTAIVPRPGGVFEADARAPLEELEAALEADLASADLDEEIETVAGLVTALAGRVPQRGEVIAHPGGYELQVLDADPRRVKRVRITPAARPQLPE